VCPPINAHVYQCMMVILYNSKFFVVALTRVQVKNIYTLSNIINTQWTLILESSVLSSKWMVFYYHAAIGGRTHGYRGGGGLKYGYNVSYYTVFDYYETFVVAQGRSVSPEPQIIFTWLQTNNVTQLCALRVWYKNYKHYYSNVLYFIHNFQ